MAMTRIRRTSCWRIGLWALIAAIRAGEGPEVIEHALALDLLLDAGGGRGFGNLLWKKGDVKLIDGWIVNGSAQLVGMVSAVMRHLQTGYLYHYAFAMIIGLLLLLVIFVK